MNNFSFKKSLLLAVLAGTLFSCKKDNNQEIQQPEQGKFEDGFFVINEGWYGHGTGSVTFFDAVSGTLKDSVFQKENPGKDFEPKSSTIQFATIFNKNLYVVSKIGGPVVVADAKTLKEIGRIPASPQSDWRAFVGLDENNGLLSSSKGIFKVNLKTYAAIQLAGTSGQTGDMFKAGKYVYTLSQSEGAVIYNAADLTVAKKNKRCYTGFCSNSKQ